MRQSTAKRLFLFGLTLVVWLPGLAFSAGENSESAKHKDTVSRILQPKLIVDTSYLDQANFSGHSGGSMLWTPLKLRCLIYCCLLNMNAFILIGAKSR